MKRKKIVALTACLLLGATLLVGCGEEDPTVTNGGETTGVVQEQSQAAVDSSTEPTQAQGTTSTEPIQTQGTTSTEPTQTQGTTSTEPTQTQGTTPTEPTQAQGTTPTEPTQAQGTTPTEPTQTEGTTPTEPVQTEPEETQPEQTKPGQEICSVETDYGELHFHVQWAPYMQIRQEKDGGTVRVFFLARLNGKDYPLFDLTISADSGREGQLQLTDYEGQKHAVEVNMETSIDHGELDAAGQEILYSMQEQVNFVIEFLE